jgi:hypothetical protein
MLILSIQIIIDYINFHNHLGLYVLKQLLFIHVAPIDTHSLPLMTPWPLALLFPSAISSHCLGLHILVPVVAPTDKANVQSPSVPMKQPA